MTITNEGPKRDDVFAFLDQHLANILMLFIYRIMLECDLACGASASYKETLAISTRLHDEGWMLRRCHAP